MSKENRFIWKPSDIKIQPKSVPQSKEEFNDARAENGTILDESNLSDPKDEDKKT